MAENGGSGSRMSGGKHPNKNQERDQKESSNGSQHKAAQTDTLHVRHVGVQLDPPSSGDEDITDPNMSVQSPSSRDVEQTNRKTSDQSVQSQEESSGGEDNQLVTGSNLNVVGSHGPVQLGTGSTVVSPTYKNCTINHHHHNNNQHHHHHHNNNQHHHHHHHYHPHPGNPAYNDYLRWIEQNAEALAPGPSYPGLTSHAETRPSLESGGNSQNVPHSHHADHMQMTERLRAERAVMPTDPSNTGTPTPDPPLPAGANQIEWRENPSNVDQITHSNHDHPTDSSEQSPSPLHVAASRLPGIESQQAEKTPSHSPSQPSDEVTKSTRDERKPERRSVDNQNMFANILSIFGFRSNAQTRPVPDDGIDTVRIIDSSGEVLEPGDAVYSGDVYAVYIGRQQIVGCVGRKPNLMVKEDTLNLTSPFKKLTVHRKGRCTVLPRRKRVERAKGRIGSLFNEGDWEYGGDFPHWVMTGMGLDQARRKGFVLWYLD